MKTGIRFSMLVLFFLFSKTTIAQLQKVDTTLFAGAGANSTVRNINIQSNGKIILTGEFNAYGGTLANRIVRLKTNGIVDTSFHSGIASEGPIRATALLLSDQLIIGGLFNSYNGTPRKNIAKINSNGTLDTSFAKGLGANNEITDMYLQHDGRVLITGFFSKYNNINFNGFLRLTHTGEIDTTFKIGTGPNLSPNAIAQQHNSKLILVGSFLTFNGIPRSKIVRVNLDGSLDTTFKNNSISSSILKVLVLNNDELIITGGFTNIDGVSKTGIAKLSKDGVLDTSFKAYIIGTVRGLHQQKDGKIIVSGDFTNVNGVTVQRLARLNLNGTLDNNFYAGFNGSVYDIEEQPDRRIILGGGFTQTTEVNALTKTTPKVVRLYNSYCIPPTTPKFNHTQVHVCKGDSLEIKLDGGELNDAQNWYWYTDSCNGLPIDSGESLRVRISGNVTYFVRAEKGCSNATNPCVGFNVFMNDTLNTQLKTVGTYIQAEETNATYQWVLCDSAIVKITGETGRAFAPIGPGYYGVILTSLDGCVDTSECVYVTIDVGISQAIKLSIQNPVTSMLIIPAAYEIVEVELISMLGQTALKTNSLDVLTEIPVNIISSGVYYLKAKDRWGNVYRQSVLIN